LWSVQISLYRVASSFKVMSPLFKPSNDGKHLSIVDLVVSLDRIECFRQEGDQVPGIVITRLLGENCSSSNARAIDNPNTTQTLEYTKDKYNAKIRKRRVSPKVPPITYKGQRIK
jgi:hypothetical protein